MPLYQDEPSADQSLMQARRTTTFALSSSFADVDLDATDVQNDTTVIEHTSADQVTIKVAGKYGITYAGTAPAGAYTTSFQVRKNDTSVLPGSERSAVSIGSDGESITGSFIADLVTGDFITLQAKVDSGTPNLAVGVTLTVVHMAGQKGDPGEASATDVNAVHVNVGAEISLIVEKTTPASDDLLIIEDSAATNIKKKLKIGNLPGGVSLSDTAPVNVTKAAASAGAGTGASRNDHKHDVTTDTPAAGAVAVGNTADEGASTSLSRADHKHSVAKGTPVDVGTANAAGAGTDFAAGNHVHAGLTRGSGDFAGFTAKGTPVASDILLIEDSAAANAKKKVTIGTLPAGVDTTAIHKTTAGEISAMTEKAAPVSADLVVIEDSADSNNKKKVQVGNLPTTAANFGKDHQSAASEGSSTTTSSTYQDKVSLTTGALTGTYLVSFFFEATPQTANKHMQSRLYNSTDAAELCFDDHRPVLTSLFKATSGFATVVFSGVAKTFKIQYASQDNSTTVEIRRARIELWRLS